MLALRIDFLSGVYHAADPTAHSAPEWPPHPDRIFQALVAASYTNGIDPTPLRKLEARTRSWPSARPVPAVRARFTRPRLG